MVGHISVEDQDGISVAHVHGEVDLSNAGKLRAALQDAVRHVSPGLVLDFSETGYLDSAGLHFVFELARRLRDRGQRLELVVPPTSPIDAVLRVVGIETLAAVSPTVTGAVARLRDHEADAPEA